MYLALAYLSRPDCLAAGIEGAMPIDWNKIRRDAVDVETSATLKPDTPSPDVYERRRARRDETREYNLAEALGARARADRAVQSLSKRDVEDISYSALRLSLLNRSRT
jgi:hypothetical protein